MSWNCSKCEYENVSTKVCLMCSSPSDDMKKDNDDIAIEPSSKSIQNHNDSVYLETYSKLINDGYCEEISLMAAQKHPNNEHAAVQYIIDNIQHIEMPINIECRRNADYCSKFKKIIPYNNKVSFTQIIKNVMEHIHQKYQIIKFYATRICNDSFIKEELQSNTDPNWYKWDMKITDFLKTDIKQYGLHIFIDISKYEHKISAQDITCNNILRPTNNDPNTMKCLHFAQMFHEYKYTEENLAHLESYNHFIDEFNQKKECKYKQDCYAFNRLKNGGNSIEDRCHVKIYRHPPRQKKYDIDEENNNIHPFVVNKGWYENTGKYAPTQEDEKNYHYDETNGYLKALIAEVIANGFKRDLCLTTEDLENNKYSILNVVEDKLKCGRHKQMGSPLNRAEMLSVILYTGCDCNYDLCKKQRNNDYETWKWFDYCLYNAILKLCKMEDGKYKIYTGLANTKLTEKSIKSGYFTTYVSTSWNKNVAISFMNGTDGMLIEMDQQFRANNICCDVSWISKFKDECEVLIARSVDMIFNNFECKIFDDIDGVQQIKLSQYTHKKIPEYISECNNMNLEDDIKEEIENKDIPKQQQKSSEIGSLDNNENDDGDDEKKNDGLDVIDDDDDDDDDDDEYLKLVSNEQDDNQKEFSLTVKAVSLSNFVRNLRESDNNAVTIQIPKVAGYILELIVEYLKHHNGKKPQEIAKPIRSIEMERIVADKWDVDYINKMNKKTVFQVILAANFMDIPSLLHLGCAKIATLIKGKSPEEIKNILADDQ